MKMITGLLAIVAGAIVCNTASAVPRYSAPVPQVGDSSNAVAAHQVDSRMNNERGGVEQEIMVDALKGCRDGATIGIVSGSLRGGIAGGAVGGVPGAAAGAAAGAASGAAAGCVKGMITGVAKGAAIRVIKDIQSESNKTNGEQDGATNETSPSTPNETLQNPNAQACQSGAKYITCAYVREIKTLGKTAHVVAGDKGLHYQLIIFDKDTGKPIASYGKTTWKETPVIGQGTMLVEKPNVKDGYNPIPKWCIESEKISVLSPEGYVIGMKDCREYAERIKDDLIKNHGGKEIDIPAFALLEVKTKCSIDTTEPETCSICVKPEEGKLDFYCLVPDKIWTEPIIGALVACEGCGNRKVDWWGAKWMGGCFDPTPAHDDLTFEHHSMYGSYKHLVGFTLNTCIMPKVYVAPFSEFSLSDAQSIEEKVRLWIEENIGVKLSKTTQTEDGKHESYTHEYSCVSEYCRVYFKSSIEAGGHRWIQKHGEKGLYEKVIRLKMNVRVYCDDWYKERLNFDSSRYSVRDLLQGKVKRK